MHLVMTSARMLRFGWQLGSTTKRVLNREPTDEEMEDTFALAKRFAPGMNAENCRKLCSTLEIYWQARAIFVIPKHEMEDIALYAWKFPQHFTGFVHEKNYPKRAEVTPELGTYTTIIYHRSRETAVSLVSHISKDDHVVEAPAVVKQEVYADDGTKGGALEEEEHEYVFSDSDSIEGIHSKPWKLTSDRHGETKKRMETGEVMDIDMVPTKRPKLAVAPREETKPKGGTRLLIGNIPFVMIQQGHLSKQWFDVDGLKKWLPGITHIQWKSKRGSDEFDGYIFVEMESYALAASAVNKADKDFNGRTLRIQYSPVRSGKNWPPSAPLWPRAPVYAMKPKGASSVTELWVSGIDGRLPRNINEFTFQRFFGGYDVKMKSCNFSKGACCVIDFLDAEVRQKLVHCLLHVLPHYGLTSLVCFVFLNLPES